MRHDISFRIARVDGRLVNFDALTGNAGALQAADEFFGFSREHGAANHFDATLTVVVVLLKHGFTEFRLMGKVGQSHLLQVRWQTAESHRHCPRWGY